jgi:Transposase and inactivated derivatives
MDYATHLFKRHRFDRLIITLCIHWYVSYKLSYRDLVEIIAERRLSIVHSTILRWVQRFMPAFEKRWRKYAWPVGRSWRVDETCIKVKGRCVYLDRAVDKQGQTVDFYLSKHRDSEAAKHFFRRAVFRNGPPKKITLDGYAASHGAGVLSRILIFDTRRVPCAGRRRHVPNTRTASEQTDHAAEPVSARAGHLRPEGGAAIGFCASTAVTRITLTSMPPKAWNCSGWRESMVSVRYQVQNVQVLDNHQALPSGLRCRSVELRRPPAALRALLHR